MQFISLLDRTEQDCYSQQDDSTAHMTMLEDLSGAI
jgi:hypothetical protein